MSDLRPFYLAFPVRDFEVSREFYVDTLGCTLGRGGSDCQDVDFFGHLLVLHLVKDNYAENISLNKDGHGIPIPHFGALIQWHAWEELRDKIKGTDCDLVVEPYVRNDGTDSAQVIMFITDPNGNTIEFKSFKKNVENFKT
ncbi:MAG: glyoxalase [Flavobacteriales bacterium]|nr:glyoxalase [Flavobacteriales bacterium]